MEKTVFRNQPVTIRGARVWCFLPDRGDLYIVLVKGRRYRQVVQLTEGGVANHPAGVQDRAMNVLVDARGRVVALSLEGEDSWKPCGKG